MASESRTIYTGATSDLESRVLQHKWKLIRGFTSRYNITKLVWYETFHDVEQAIESEKRIKSWRRSKKLDLIEESNPYWEDLAESWYSSE